MTRTLAPMFAGLVFALGLGLAGMTQPTRVLAFLELRDPALALTMGAAVAVTWFGFPRVLRRGRPLVEPRFVLPTRREVDRWLWGGAALFGLGWGLVGLCPGPALTGLVAGVAQQWLFVAAMLAGMALHHFTRRSPR